MKSVVLAILISAPIYAQTLHGLGFSSKTCIDLDGDGYGTGPLANLVAVAAGSVTAGVQTVSIGATTGLAPGQRVRYDTGPNLEFVTLTAVSGTTITGTFSTPHATGVTVSAGTVGDGSLWFPGFATDDPGCLGLDADDHDGTVQTAAQGIAKYGSLTAFLAKLGNDWKTLESDSAADVNGNAGQAVAAGALLTNTAHTYYLAPASASSGCTGTSAQCAGLSYPAHNCTSINSPCLTISDLLSAGYSNSGLGGDLIIARDGWNNNFLVVRMWSGSSSRYNGLWSYPGEHAVLSNGIILGAPTSCPVPNSQSNYIWVDGMRLKSTTAHFGGAIVGGSCPGTSGQNHDIVITHNHGTESDNGNLAPLTGFNHIDDWTIAYNVLHDDNCPTNCNTPHGFYMGGGQGPSSNTTIRRNLIFRNSWNGMHWNGQATGFFIDQNVVYDNGVTGMDFEMGLSHSYIRANQSFNNAKQLVFFLYPGNCPTQSSYDPASPLVLCPTGENYNVIENNTFYATGNANMANAGTSPDGGCPTGVLYCAQPPIQISNASSPLVGDMGNNTFRNNIIVAYGWNGRKPGVAFGDPTASGTCGAACQGWAQTSTFDHNLFWQSDGLGGSTVLLMAANRYTCSSAATVTATFTNCNVGDPQFAAEATSRWNMESYFDFRPLPSSPALHVGSVTGIPNYDTSGRAYSSNPSLGALESSSLALPASTAPTISITSPVGGASVSGSVIVSASASAPVGIASIQFKLDGANLGAAGNSTPYSVSWTTSGVGNGSHTLTAVIFDLSGNSVTSAGVGVSVNNAIASPPTISITSPASGASLQGTVSISATASPGSLAIASVQFKIDSADSGPAVTASPYLLLLATAGLTNGTHTISATAIDTAGNTGASAAVTVTVNNPNTSGLPPTQGLTGYWNFNENSGTTAHDSSGNGYNGTVTGATWATGYMGSALSFNGGTSYVVTSTIPQGGAVSISAWANAAVTTQISYARIAETRYNTGFFLGTDSTGTHYKFIVNNGVGSTGSCGASFGCAQGGTVNSGWHLITGTYDGTTATLYVDNLAVAHDTFTAPASVSFPLYFGRYFSASGSGWNGAIDEVRLYNRALAGAEISAIYSYRGAPSVGNPPLVNMTSPSASATISSTVSVTATATPSGSASIASVQFQLDGSNLGSALTSAPYSASWNTTTATNGTHTLTATAMDSLGNAGSSSPMTVTVSNVSSALGPAISGVTTGSITASAATISWTTGTASGSQVSYGTTNAYGLTSTLATSLVTAHVVTISGLSPSTTYHYQVLSRDGQGNLASSADFSFTSAASSSSFGWQDLTNTKLKSVCPPNYFNGINYTFADRCGGVVTAWSGAVSDTRRNRLIIWGGGHTDYSGNEVYSLNLGAAPPTLTRLTNPSDFTQNPAGCPDTNTVDGTPVSRHTYGGIVYLPVQDKMLSFAGALAPCGGPYSNRTYTLDLSQAVTTWQAMDPIKGYNLTGYQAGTATCGYDPNTQTVICNTSGIFFRYDPATNTNTLLSTGQNTPYAGYGVIDPKRKLFIFMGTQYQSTTPNVFALDISSGSSFHLQDWTSQVTGCDALAGSSNPGLAYDPILDRIVGWPNAGNSVYIFNADQKSCTVQTFSNGPTNTAADAGNGTFGRFQYFPALNAYAVVSLATLDAYKLTLSPTPQPLVANLCDLNSDSVVNNLDVQIAINQALGTTPCSNASLQGNGQCTVVGVQRVVNASLGGACISGP